MPLTSRARRCARTCAGGGGIQRLSTERTSAAFLAYLHDGCHDDFQVTTLALTQARNTR